MQTMTHNRIEQIRQKVNDLYVVRRNKYLLQSNDGSNYYTMAKGISKDPRPLVDSMIDEHLQGTRTIGIFATNVSKVMIFDFDFKDDWNTCKWHYYAVRFTLLELGIPSEHIHVTFSGSKGIHLEIYFDEPIPVETLKQFYFYVLGESGRLDLSDKIEFRPTDKQGVKLPLGVHQKTKRRCDYRNPLDVDESLPMEYVFDIEPMESEYFITEIIGMMDNDWIDDDNGKPVIRKSDAYSLHDMDLSDEYFEQLMENGIPFIGTRHHSTFQLAVYFKSRLGIGKGDTIRQLVDWIQRQPQSVMDTPKEKAVELTKEIVEKVFYYDYTLDISEKEITVTRSELKFILSAMDSNGKLLTPKQKYVLFALLGHSKRYGGQSDVFYMTYEQMTEKSGIKNRRILIDLMSEFESVGFITVHRSNQKQSGTIKKLPNMYSVNFADDKKTAECATNTNDGTIISGYDDKTFRNVINSIFDKSELKSLLPRRQFKTLCG